MLELIIPEIDLFNENDNSIVTIKGTTLKLEHSLVSISKWESKYHRPFLSKAKKSPEEILDYIRMMTISQNVDPMVYDCLSPAEINRITEYINDPMTATTIYDFSDKKQSKEQVTSELIYYWMISSSIPMECQKWHLNRLMMLIRVCSAKNTPPKKMSQSEIMSRNASLNAKRRAALKSKG